MVHQPRALTLTSMHALQPDCNPEVLLHDHIMRELRTPGGPRYSVPYGGLFDWPWGGATCAHYLAELWAWLGFWLLSCGPNGAFIFCVSLVNLVPRAASTHAWYLYYCRSCSKFPTRNPNPESSP